MVLAQAKGWEAARSAKWEMRERTDWRRVNRQYKDNAMRARARIVALGAVEVLLNAVINNALHEIAEQEKARVAAQKQKAKPASRRTYYAVITNIVDGRVIFRLTDRKPKDFDSMQNGSRVRGANFGEARAAIEKMWNSNSMKEAA